MSSFINWLRGTQGQDQEVDQEQEQEEYAGNNDQEESESAPGSESDVIAAQEQDERDASLQRQLEQLDFNQEQEELAPPAEQRAEALEGKSVDEIAPALFNAVVPGWFSDGYNFFDPVESLMLSNPRHLSMITASTFLIFGDDVTGFGLVPVPFDVLGTVDKYVVSHIPASDDAARGDNVWISTSLVNPVTLYRLPDIDVAYSVGTDGSARNTIRVMRCVEITEGANGPDDIRVRYIVATHTTRMLYTAYLAGEEPAQAGTMRLPVNWNQGPEAMLEMFDRAGANSASDPLLSKYLEMANVDYTSAKDALDYVRRVFRLEETYYGDESVIYGNERAYWVYQALRLLTYKSGYGWMVTPQVNTFPSFLATSPTERRELTLAANALLQDLEETKTVYRNYVRAVGETFGHAFTGFEPLPNEEDDEYLTVGPAFLIEKGALQPTMLETTELRQIGNSVVKRAFWAQALGDFETPVLRLTLPLCQDATTPEGLSYDGRSFSVLEITKDVSSQEGISATVKSATLDTEGIEIATEPTGYITNVLQNTIDTMDSAEFLTLWVAARAFQTTAQDLAGQIGAVSGRVVPYVPINYATLATTVPNAPINWASLAQVTSTNLLKSALLSPTVDDLLGVQQENKGRPSWMPYEHDVLFRR